MRRALAEEWRAVRRDRLVWCMPLAVVALALLMGPANGRYAERNAGFDPQGFEQQWDVYLVSGVQLYTSGFFAGQLVAALFGALLVLRDRRPDPPVRWAKLAAAMLGGVGLGVTTFAAAASVAGRRAADSDLVPALDDYGVPFDLTILNHAAAWRAIAVGLVGFALWAIVGVGLAAFTGRWVVPVLSVPLGWLVGWGVVEWFALGDGGDVYWGLWWLLLAVVVVPILPATSNAYLVDLTIDSVAGAVGAVLVMALYATVSTVIGRYRWRPRPATHVPAASPS
jgi:hypothetical protein